MRYALIGGVAMAFYDHPRFARDIVLLLHSEDLPAARAVIESARYFESAQP